MKAIKNYNLTDASESVAWNGTLILTKGTKNHYLNYHSGNSNHEEMTVKVPVNMVEKVTKMDKDEALEMFWALKGC